MKLPKKRSNKPSAILIGVALVLTGTVYWYSGQVGQTPALPSDSSQVAETNPKPTDSQQVEKTEVPVRIVIDKIGVDAPIIPVGLTEDGLMDDPDSNEQVGWYEKSARAGEDKLAMLLDGHYGSDSVPAVFRNLIDLEKGDSIQVEGEDGMTLDYRVVESYQRYAEDVDMKKALYPYRDGVQSLTIITCEGQYDPVNVTYDKRTVVYAIRS